MIILNLITYDVYALVGYRTFNIFSLFWDSKFDSSTFEGSC